MILSRLIFIFLLYFTFLAFYAFVPLSIFPLLEQSSHPATDTIIPSIIPTFSPIPTWVENLHAGEDIQHAQQVSISQNDLLSQINTFRKENGTAPIEANNTTCSFAQVRANEITTHFSHDGFEQRVTTHTLPYGNYALIVENIAMNPNESDVVSAWINSPGHRANLLANTTYGCVAQNGNYYAYEGER